MYNYTELFLVSNEPLIIRVSVFSIDLLYCDEEKKSHLNTLWTCAATTAAAITQPRTSPFQSNRIEKIRLSFKLVASFSSKDFREERTYYTNRNYHFYKWL